MIKIVTPNGVQTIDEAGVVIFSDLPEYANAPFIMHRCPEDEDRVCITEPFTGRRMTDGSDIDEARSNLDRALARIAPKDYVYRIKLFLKGQPPLNEIPEYSFHTEAA